MTPYNATITLSVTRTDTDEARFDMTTASSDEVPEERGEELQKQYSEMLSIGLADVILVNCGGEVSEAVKWLSRSRETIEKYVAKVLADTYVKKILRERKGGEE